MAKAKITIEYDDNGFDCNGIHCDTGTKYDPDGFNYEGYDAEGYDVDGFNEDGYNREGYDQNGYNRNGRDREGYDEDGYDREGYDADGYDSDGYNRDGFDSDGIHRDTGTEYNEDGYDCDGNERESNFSEELEPYGTDVIARCGYCFPDGWENVLLAGHEIEMYSNDVCIDDTSEVRRQFDRAYRAAGGVTTRACVAKYDGSLGEGGFEVATVPLTPEQTYRIFESIETLDGGANVSAWDHGCEVGHHIHVNAAPISPLTLGKLGVFMNLPHNRLFMEHVAQRGADYNGFEDQKKLTSRRAQFRHAVLNPTGGTVEFRLFKANLRSTGILKNYEFAISAIRFCEWASHSHLTYEDYMRYLAARRHEYRYLCGFLVRGTTNLFAVEFKSMLNAHSLKATEKLANLPHRSTVA